MQVLASVSSGQFDLGGRLSSEWQAATSGENSVVHWAQSMWSSYPVITGIAGGLIVLVVLIFFVVMMRRGGAIRTLREELAASRQEVAQKQRTIETVKGNEQSATKRGDALVKEREALQTEKAELQRQLSEAQAAARLSETRRSEAAQRVTALEQDLAKKVEEHRQALADLRAQHNAAMSQERTNHRNELSQLQGAETELASARERLEAARASVEERSAALDAREAELDRREQGILAATQLDEPATNGIGQVQDTGEAPSNNRRLANCLAAALDCVRDDNVGGAEKCLRDGLSAVEGNASCSSVRKTIHSALGCIQGGDLEALETIIATAQREAAGLLAV
ncbi:MAG: hypothetical protein KDD64_08785 [Bdellovibrionales bacterium]|nr:hypothetical protein [Bdellovibrionales bacterium]